MGVQLWTWVSIFAQFWIKTNFELIFGIDFKSIAVMLLALLPMRPVVPLVKIMECNRQVDIQDYVLVMDRLQPRDIIHKVIISVRIRTHSKRKHLIRQRIKCKIPSKVPSNNRIKRLCNQWQTVYRMDFRLEKLCSIDSKMLSNRYHLSHNNISNRKPFNNHNNINSLLTNKHQIISKLIHINSHRINSHHISTNNHLKPINHLPINNNQHINRMLIRRRRPINNQSHKIHF